MSRSLLLVVLGAFTLLAGCKDKEAPKESTEPPPVVSAAPTLPTPVPIPEAAPVPTEADFEEEAAQQITNKNLEEELDKLERELKSQ